VSKRGLRATGVLVLLAGVVTVTLAGCARGGEGQTSVVPEKVLDFVIQFSGSIVDNFYYFVAIDADGDDGIDGPLPIAAGPRWGNGWGTGSFTHYVVYNAGLYDVYKVDLNASLDAPAAGINTVAGVPDSTDAGVHQLTITQIDCGSVTVGGAGTIAAVINTGFQSAGTISIETDASGQTVAGGVTYTPAASGGRSLTTDEQAALDALNTGGVPLQTDSLQALGLQLTLGAASAGTQTLTIAQSTAQVRNAFTSASTQATTTTTATLNSNSAAPTTNPPIPGLVITCNDLVLDETATIRLETSPETVTEIGRPYEYTAPIGGNTLRFTLDVAQLDTTVDNLSINIITTTELIFDPNITLPSQHVYDGLGHLGNRYITISLDEYRTIQNSDGLFEEELAGDNTLEGPASDDAKRAVDIVNWWVRLRRLR